jgi:carbon starvation protein
MIAMRHEGASFGGLSHKLISPRARIILLSFIYFYLLLIAGAFGNVVVSTAIGLKAAPMAWLFLTIGGVLAGQMIYRWKKDIILTTVVTVVIALIGIWLGTVAPSDSILGPDIANSKLILGNRCTCLLLFCSGFAHLEVCTSHQLCCFLHYFPGIGWRDYRSIFPPS